MGAAADSGPARVRASADHRGWDFGPLRGVRPLVHRQRAGLNAQPAEEAARPPCGMRVDTPATRAARVPGTYRLGRQGGPRAPRVRVGWPPGPQDRGASGMEREGAPIQRVRPRRGTGEDTLPRLDTRRRGTRSRTGGAPLLPAAPPREARAAGGARSRGQSARHPAARRTSTQRPGPRPSGGRRAGRATGGPKRGRGEARPCTRGIHRQRSGLSSRHPRQSAPDAPGRRFPRRRREKGGATTLWRKLSVDKPKGTGASA